jgi:hypothetical protein
MQNTVSSKTLIKASLSASIVAAIAIVTLILPAEYNIDPTGIGGKLGLTVLAKAGEEQPAKVIVANKDTNEFKVIEVSVPAGRGIEYKFYMKQHEKMTYEWITDGEPLYFDLHGEPEEDTTGYFESFAIATTNEMQGSFTTPFPGSHGWYWRNNTDKAIDIQLKVKGQYEVIGLKK